MKNIEGKNEQQLTAIKNQGERQVEAIRYQGEKQLDAMSSYSATIKSHKIESDNEKNQEAKKLVNYVEEISTENKSKKSVCFHSN